MHRFALVLALAVAALALGGTAAHATACGTTSKCAGHEFWPTIDRANVHIAGPSGGIMRGPQDSSSELLGFHGSDTLYGGDVGDVLWGDYIGENQPVGQVDKLYGAGGSDFLYSSHGRNTIDGGPGNDAIKVRYGRGSVNCGSGRDIVYVPKSRKRNWTFAGCEKFEYRSESALGHGLKPLP
ncbi:MAG: calcium-binding protein [Solirubrobacterales bacterium]|nr:calcium-binding protein [Solirubrobacterales bacterium]